MSRGKQLHSGMNSLNSFQPAADRFCSWLSEVESNIEMLEVAGDKLRIKYKDKQIPDTELVKFKVGGIFAHIGANQFWRYQLLMPPW